MPWPVKPIAQTAGALTLFSAPLRPVRDIGLFGVTSKIRDLRTFDPARRPVGIDARHVSAGRERLDQRAVDRRDDHISGPE